MQLVSLFICLYVYFYRFPSSRFSLHSSHTAAYARKHTSTRCAAGPVWLTDCLFGCPVSWCVADTRWSGLMGKLVENAISLTVATVDWVKDVQGGTAKKKQNIELLTNTKCYIYCCGRKKKKKTTAGSENVVEWFTMGYGRPAEIILIPPHRVWTVHPELQQNNAVIMQLYWFDSNMKHELQTLRILQNKFCYLSQKSVVCDCCIFEIIELATVFVVFVVTDMTTKTHVSLCVVLRRAFHLSFQSNRFSPHFSPVLWYSGHLHPSWVCPCTLVRDVLRTRAPMCWFPQHQFAGWLAGSSRCLLTCSSHPPCSNFLAHPGILLATCTPMLGATRNILA